MLGKVPYTCLPHGRKGKIVCTRINSDPNLSAIVFENIDFLDLPGFLLHGFYSKYCGSYIA